MPSIYAKWILGAYKIRNYDNPSEVLVIENIRGQTSVKWTAISKEQLLSNKSKLQLSLWNFKLTKSKVLGGKKNIKKSSDSCCIQ